ncbi:porin family protein [Rhodoplanes sp. TEM]|uniref:Porin family protein n=1 Tax=Rhodoplanes tepidamans TaxID=200616 RepID=A0ABT5JJK6_RHOTP|nr:MULTISPECIES: outer membrane protein [Rhodoplanes]MDC7789558.1 porin family protein [Rhodoplanes tepidamans]MDC7986733.1 porin family protein [Rhodoplanes sp. TEM]MDQ0359153.1 outer membrane immunogenic protein [Rhodoplanes tepidamans]
MKTILLGTVAALAIAGTASAADLRMPVKAPPPVVAPVFSWTGCYIGGFVGGAWSADDPTVYDRDGYNVGETWSYKADSSFIGGGTLGCNWQPVGSPFVLGLEGEVGYLSLEGSGYSPFGLEVISSTKVGDWYGMITGRLGYSWDRAMIYVKGGAAFVDVEHSIVDAVLPATVAASVSDTKVTWTVGGGIEWAFDMNWSIKAEYMYIGLNGSETSCGVATVTAPVGTFCWDHDYDGIHTAKIGLNYRFGGGAPLVARY